MTVTEDIERTRTYFGDVHFATTITTDTSEDSK